MKDQRRFKRYNIDVPARIELIQSRRKQKVIEAHVVDLSAVGGFFPDVKSLPLGQLLKVDIFLPFERPNPSVEKHELITMTVTGQVVRSGSSGTAIAFTQEYGLTSRKICKGAEERRRRKQYLKKYTTTQLSRNLLPVTAEAGMLVYDKIIKIMIPP